MSVATVDHLSFAEFLALESEAETKHEYVRGQRFAMAGTTVAHNRVSRNLLVALSQRLAGGPCEPFVADVLLRIEDADVAYYPDLFVVCGEPAGDDERVVGDATLVVEVLSVSTESHDRGDKLKNYLRLASLAEYVLVDSRARSVEIYRRGPVGWSYLALSGDDPIVLESVDLVTSFDALYANVQLDEAVSPG